MTDNILNASVLAVMVAMAIAAAVGSPKQPGARNEAAAAAGLPVVMLPAVVVTGKRQAPTDNLAGASKAAPEVVQLPLVAVSGRRVPAMETVRLAEVQ
jgi:hypothetical protein